MPFITEELWQQFKTKIKTKAKSIMTDSFPKSSKSIPYEGDALQLEVIKKIIDAIRNIRGEHNIKPQQQMETTINVPSEEDKELIEAHRPYIEKLANLKELKVSTTGEKPQDVATAIVEGMEVLVPWKGLVDVEAEKARLSKELAKIETDRQIVQKKLANESFVTKAPPPVVAKEREKLSALEEKLARLKEAFEKLT